LICSLSRVLDAAPVCRSLISCKRFNLEQP
jgi:hypothetical protein